MFMRILSKLLSKTSYKTNIEYVFKHSIVCSALKVHFSQEILGEERIPIGSPEENNSLMCMLPNQYDLHTLLQVIINRPVE